MTHARSPPSSASSSSSASLSPIPHTTHSRTSSSSSAGAGATAGGGWGGGGPAPIGNHAGAGGGGGVAPPQSRSVPAAFGQRVVKRRRDEPSARHDLVPRVEPDAVGACGVQVPVEAPLPAGEGEERHRRGHPHVDADHPGLGPPPELARVPSAGGEDAG